MMSATQQDWLKDFGIDGRGPPSLFTGKDYITQSTPQAHLLRRAFDVLNAAGVIIDSARPTRARLNLPTLKPASALQQAAYRDRLCGMLNGWATSGQFAVRGQVQASDLLGIGVVTVEKVERALAAEPMADSGKDLIQLLDKIRKAIPRKYATLDVVRGVTVFDDNRLYVVKPIGQRFWTQSAAMNDADEIASIILMRPQTEDE